jgi:hypothetical protein
LHPLSWPQEQEQVKASLSLPQLTCGGDADVFCGAVLIYSQYSSFDGVAVT